MATATQQVSTPQRRGTGWRVPSASGRGHYYVEITEDTVRCTCPAWVHRRTQLGGACKHIRAVLEEVAMAE
jgi:uncharacterized Zn finger protein